MAFDREILPMRGGAEQRRCIDFGAVNTALEGIRRIRDRIERYLSCYLNQAAPRERIHAILQADGLVVGVECPAHVMKVLTRCSEPIENNRHFSRVLSPKRNAVAHARRCLRPASSDG